jgi:Flp pilus assembly CpaE family ATPase
LSCEIITMALIGVARWQLDKYYVLRYHYYSTITTVKVPGQSQARNLYFDATLQRVLGYNVLSKVGVNLKESFYTVFSREEEEEGGKLTINK